MAGGVLEQRFSKAYSCCLSESPLEVRGATKKTVAIYRCRAVGIFIDFPNTYQNNLAEFLRSSKLKLFHFKGRLWLYDNDTVQYLLNCAICG